ncbi:MAG: TetR/AcrR family transcriptional regulator [Methylocella sp.]
MIAKALRQRLNPAKRRELILDEALQLFTKRHYSIVTVREIAVQCGINVGLIYHYFDSKDHLFRCALEYAIDQLVAAFEERQRELEDPLSVIMAWLDAHTTLTPVIARMVKVMADYAAFGMRKPEVDELVSGFYRRERELLEDALRRGIRMGAFRPVDAPKMARLIGLHLDGIFHGSESRGDHRIEEDIRDLEDVVKYLIVMR